jgi:PAT family beta-lactamase induction signal transducer AmpG
MSEPVTAPASFAFAETRAQPIYKYVVLFFLYLSQSVPAAFFLMAFPVLLRQGGMSLDKLGYLNLLMLPGILRILWAPSVDRIGTYRGWIMPMQALCIGLMLMIGRLNWATEFQAVFVVCLFYTIFSVTQDIGVDGLAIRALSPAERPTGNAISVAGQYIGTIAGGGAMIMLYNRTGLQFNITILAIVLAIPMVLLLFYEEPRVAAHPQRSLFGDVSAMFRRPGMASWLAVLVFYSMAPLLAGGMVRPLLVDRHVSLETLGLVTGVIQPVLAIAGCAFAPKLIVRFGRKDSLLIFGVLQVLQIVGYLVLALTPFTLGYFYALSGFLGFTAGFPAVLLYAIVQDKSSPALAGTDFTLQATVYGVGVMSAGVAGGIIAQYLGYANLFWIALALQVAILLGIARYISTHSLEVAEGTTPMHVPIGGIGERHD